MKKLASLIFFKLLGWKMSGSFDPEIKKSVIIVLPHTSWHDFYIGALARKIIGIPISFVAKKELFTGIFGWYFRWMGGVPLDRTISENKVEAISRIFLDRVEFRLAIAPEGTRKKVEAWKTGFYYIALAAKVPIICVAFDYNTKTVKIADPFYSSGSYATDLLHLQLFYKDIIGKNPHYT